MSSSLLLPVLAASLVGSLHCAGMCGPLAAVAVGGGRWTQHAAYHGSRGAAYVLLGAIAGALGVLIDLAGSLGGLQTVAGLVAGGTLVLVGLATIAREFTSLGAPPVARRLMPASVASALTRLRASALRTPPTMRAVALGTSSSLLPCGWLYAFVLAAAGTADAGAGALIMAAFWLGTVPILTAVGGAANLLRLRFGHRLGAVTGAILVVLGCWGLSGRLDLVPEDLAAAVEARSDSPGDLPDADEVPACCAQPSER